MLKTFRRSLKTSGPRSSSTASLRRDERGLSTVEYIILLILIAASCIAVWKSFGTTVKNKIGEADKTVEEEVKIQDQ